MKKEGKIKFAAILFFITLIIGISIVYGAQNENLIFEDTTQVELVKQYESATKDFLALKVYDYIDKNTEANFKVQISEFENEEKLDSWIKNKVEKSSEKREIDGNIVFVDENKNYLFWRSGNKFIQILAIRGETSDARNILEMLKSMGESNFPNELIENYLIQYPSDCNSEDCFSKNHMKQEKILEALHWFYSPPEGVKSSNYYVGGGGKCPRGQEKFDRIQKNLFLTDEEILFLKDYCENNDFYEIAGAQISEELKDCGRELNQYLNEKEIDEYDYEIVLDECLLREFFLEERGNDLSSEQTEAIFSKRDDKILNDVLNSNILRSEQKIAVITDGERSEVRDRGILPSRTEHEEISLVESEEISDRLFYLKEGIREENRADDNSPWFK